jgi:hypothetical protein
LEAAAIFDRLAATANSVPPDVITVCDELFEDHPDFEEWNEMRGQVGFHTDYRTAEEFVRKFIGNMVG